MNLVQYLTVLSIICDNNHSRTSSVNFFFFLKDLEKHYEGARLGSFHICRLNMDQSLKNLSIKSAVLVLICYLSSFINNLLAWLLKVLTDHSN